MTRRLSPASLRFAAQADLVALTAEMLRSPQSAAQPASACWYAEPVTSYRALLAPAFPLGSAGQLASGPLECRKASPAALSPLERLLEGLHAAATTLDHEDWSDEYWRLFDGAQACPLNQASYIRRDKGTILGDLAGFYRAFGWQHNVENAERPDHLLSQLEFAAVLLAMAATATSRQQREIVTKALAEFHRVHMHDWLPSVCHQMRAATSFPYFELAAQWLGTLWETLAEVNTWPADLTPDALLAPRLDPEDPYECGAPDLVTLQATATPAVYREG